MIYYVDREVIDTNQGCRVSLSGVGKFIAFIELAFYTFIFFAVQDYLAGEIDKLIILTTCLCLLAVFSLSLFVGVINQSPLYILPWIWIKYAMIILQVLRFLSVIVEIAATNKNHAGASPVFELLFLGYNVFALSIISELVAEEIEPYTFKRYEYVRL